MGYYKRVPKGDSMKDMSAGVRVYEVVSALHEVDGTYKECDDSEYLVYYKGQEPDFDQMIKDSEVYTKGRLIQIYCARSGGLIFDKNGQFCDHDGDIDCSTGYNGSPILETWFDEEGKECYINSEGTEYDDGTFVEHYPDS